MLNTSTTFNLVDIPNLVFSNDTYVSFDYYNVDYCHKRFFGKAIYLFDDWMNETNYCPSNDELVFALTFIDFDKNVTTAYIDSIKFEKLMKFISKKVVNTQKQAGGSDDILSDIEIYTDGSCLGNPGEGGYCAIIIMGDNEKIIKGYSEDTTNNIMELTAVVEALSAIQRKCNVTVNTDSQYVSNAFNKGWITKWQKNNWKLSTGEPVKNIDLWKRLYELCNFHNVKFVWVKGHSYNELNNKCDEIAHMMATSHGKYID